MLWPSLMCQLPLLFRTLSLSLLLHSFLHLLLHSFLLLLPLRHRLMRPLLMLELLSVEGRTLAEAMAEFRSRYFISGEINSEVDDPEAKMAEIAGRWSDGELTRLDGISIDYSDWHFNVRPSNTEPLLRLNLESLTSREDMERRRDELLGLIRA